MPTSSNDAASGGGGGGNANALTQSGGGGYHQFTDLSSSHGTVNTAESHTNSNSSLPLLPPPPSSATISGWQLHNNNAATDADVTVTSLMPSMIATVGFSATPSTRPPALSNAFPNTPASAVMPPLIEPHQFFAHTTVLRLRGLPYSANENDVKAFFAGFDLAGEHPPGADSDATQPTTAAAAKSRRKNSGTGAPTSVLVLTQGYHRGEAFVRFASEKICQQAYAARNRASIGERYIELYASNVKAMGDAYRQQLQLQSEVHHVLRMRGLPFSVTVAEIHAFFAGLPGEDSQEGFTPTSSYVLPSPPNVAMLSQLLPLQQQLQRPMQQQQPQQQSVQQPNPAIVDVVLCVSQEGRFIGEAFVEVRTLEQWRAAVTYDRRRIGTRYIEIFESNAQERDAVLMAANKRFSARNSMQQQQQQQQQQQHATMMFTAGQPTIPSAGYDGVLQQPGGSGEATGSFMAPSGMPFYFSPSAAPQTMPQQQHHQPMMLRVGGHVVTTHPTLLDTVATSQLQQPQPPTSPVYVVTGADGKPQFFSTNSTGGGGGAHSLSSSSSALNSQSHPPTTGGASSGGGLNQSVSTPMIRIGGASSHRGSGSLPMAEGAPPSLIYGSTETATFWNDIEARHQQQQQQQQQQQGSSMMNSNTSPVHAVSSMQSNYSSASALATPPSTTAPRIQVLHANSATPNTAMSRASGLPTMLGPGGITYLMGSASDVAGGSDLHTPLMMFSTSGAPSPSFMVNPPSGHGVSSSLLESSLSTTNPHHQRPSVSVSVPPSYSCGSGGGGGAQLQYVVRLRGLPFSSNERDVATFLEGIHIRSHGVHMVYNAQDRPTGEAFVELMSEQDMQAALQLHRKTMGSRYVEVYRSGHADMQRLQAAAAAAATTRGGSTSTSEYALSASHPASLSGQSTSSGFLVPSLSSSPPMQARSHPSLSSVQLISADEFALLQHRQQLQQQHQHLNQQQPVSLPTVPMFTTTNNTNQQHHHQMWPFPDAANAGGAS